MCFSHCSYQRAQWMDDPLALRPTQTVSLSFCFLLVTCRLLRLSLRTTRCRIRTSFFNMRVTLRATRFDQEGNSHISFRRGSPIKSRLLFLPGQQWKMPKMKPFPLLSMRSLSLLLKSIRFVNACFYLPHISSRIKIES